MLKVSKVLLQMKKWLHLKILGLRKKELSPLPHLVISFGDEDAGNLSYRALRHMLQLQIPLKVTVLVGENYSHDVSELRMMALGRRNTFIQVHPYNLPEVFASADIVLCASGYMPYEVAVMGIPCVILAQNDFELSLAFPKEQHGFIHLGAGRKVKQSSLLNAIMEPFLHEPLRKKAIARQTALGLMGTERIPYAKPFFITLSIRSDKPRGRQEKKHLICYNREKDRRFSL